MAHHSDDLYLGGFTGTQGLTDFKTGGGTPTLQIGVGPAGRIFFRNIVPLALATNNVATAQALTAATPLTLAAGAGVTVALAPDGSGSNVYMLDVPRCVSLTSAGNLSGLTFLVTGFDQYNVRMTQLITGPNANTVTSLKAFMSILSVVPSATSATTLSVGTSDIFGLPYVCPDAGYIISAKWNNTLAQNAGTLTIADSTSPATSLTGDVRGTFAQAGAASNGARRLLIAVHLDATQCGPQPTVVALRGVQQA